MASTYVKEFTVPPEMPEVLRDFTREVLRDQPTDINSCYHYFMGKIRERGEDRRRRARRDIIERARALAPRRARTAAGDLQCAITAPSARARAR